MSMMTPLKKAMKMKPAGPGPETPMMGAPKGSLKMGKPHPLDAAPSPTINNRGRMQRISQEQKACNG